MGEIDCREGILSSIERDYYENFEAAVTHTINVFVPVLKELVTVNKLTVSNAVCVAINFTNIVVLMVVAFI